MVWTRTVVNPITADKIKLSPQPAKRPLEDKNGNGVADWEEELLGSKEAERSSLNPNDYAAALIIEALKKKQAPLLPVDILPASPNKVYQLSDLKLMDLENELLLKEYGKTLAQIMSVYRSPGLGNELNLILEITEEGNQKARPGIVEAATRYKKTTDKLLGLTVPKSASQIHLNLINSLTRLSENAWLMTQINEEPALALGAAQLQTSRLRQALTAIANINLFFAGYNLGFENDEGAIIAIDL